MSLVLKTPPTSEPLDVSDIQQHCRIDHDEENELLDAYIFAAREQLEQHTWRQFITATYELRLDCFPECETIWLPRPPLQSITSVKYIDVDGAEQTLDPSLYQTDTNSEPGRLVPARNESWPDTQSETLNAVTIEYVAGYGDSATDVPERIRQAARLMVGTLYENREEIGRINYEIKGVVMALLSGTRFRDSRVSQYMRAGD